MTRRHLTLALVLLSAWRLESDFVTRIDATTMRSAAGDASRTQRVETVLCERQKKLAHGDGLSSDASGSIIQPKDFGGSAASLRRSTTTLVLEKSSSDDERPKREYSSADVLTLPK